MSRSCSLSPKTSEAELFLPWGMRGFPGRSNGKESVYNVGDPVLISGSGRSSEERIGNHSSTLDWRIPWTEKPSRLLSMGSQESDDGGLGLFSFKVFKRLDETHTCYKEGSQSLVFLMWILSKTINTSQHLDYCLTKYLKTMA